MEELVITPSTVVLLLVIVACAALAVRRLLRRGMCDCGDSCESKGCAHCAKNCEPGAECNAVKDMVAKMESSL
ncbi:hypothetical protein [Adlercreutzia sp. ZJ154]|uniref:hypothetical protein n=1 Tax=Adlercreutzia sp. ZJ154 TaxID=2709790 RepID=UPI0013EB572D|nr:hypothetical protein [Adlercreutzia sp. ZJ154]